MKRLALVILCTSFAFISAYAQTDEPTNRLISAVQSKNLTGVQESLAQGADVNARDDSGSPPLTYAVSAGNVEITELLLQKGARLDMNDAMGRCPVIIAVQKGSVEILKILVAHGGDLSHRHVFADGDAQTPLHVAVQEEDSQMVKYLLSQNVSMETRNSSGQSPLLLAAEIGSLDMVKLLIENGAYLYADRGLGTLLESEVYKKISGYKISPAIMQYLQQIEQQRLSTYDAPAWTTTIQRDELTKQIDPTTIEEYLKQGGDPAGRDKDGQTLLHYAAEVNIKNRELFEWLVTASGLDVNAVDMHGQTPLHRVCCGDQVENVKILLDYGAVVDARDHCERTPLIVLAKYYDSNRSGLKKEIQITRVLLDHGADINAVDVFGDTPLLCVSYKRMDSHLEFIQLLIEHGAEINHQNYMGNTFLHNASESGTAAMMELAIQTGADLNIRNFKGWSILDYAGGSRQQKKIDLLFQYKKDVSVLEVILYAQPEILDYLVQQGANINEATDYDNNATPLIVAVKGENLNMVNKLLGLGAMVNTQDSLGSTALHYAAEIGLDGIVDLLLNSGADVTIRNNQGWRPIDLAGANDRYRVMQLFKDQFPDMEPSTQPVMAQEESGESEPADEVIVIEQEMTEATMKALLSQLAAESDPNMLQALTRDSNRLEAQLQQEERKWQTQALLSKTSKPLHRAVIQNQKDTVAELLKSGADVHEIDEDDRLPMTYATLLGNTEMVSLLLEHGADINRLDSNEDIYSMTGYMGWGHSVGQEAGWSALHYATAAGSKEMMEFLIEHGADVNLPDKERQKTPLFIAVDTARPEIIKILLDAGADLKLTDEMGDTPLHTMARYAYIEQMRVLLQLGADINALNQEGFTPLMTAAEMGKDDVMIFLLQNGADINVLNEKAGDLLCSLVSGINTEETLRILIEYGIDVNAKTSKGTPALFCLFNEGGTMETGLRKNVQLLLDAGFDANATDEEGDTSLHYAVNTHCREEDDRYKLAKMLIDYSADVNKTNTKGETPLHIMLNPYAGSSKSEELIRLLAENNTHLNDTDRYGCNTLHNAAIRGRADIVSLLASKGADIENRNDDSHGNQTPLLSAIKKKHVETVRVLIDLGADLEAQDNWKRNSLFTAVWTEDTELMQLLLDYKADCNSKDSNGDTPLHWAVENENKEIVQILLNAGARSDLTNRNGRTPLELAKMTNESEIAAILEAAEN